MSSIMRRRNGLIASSVMGDAPVLSEVANSSSSRQDASSRYRVAVPAARGALPRERFSPLALSIISLLRSDSVAFGCEADMRTIDRSNQSDVNDPQQTLAGLFCCAA